MASSDTVICPICSKNVPEKTINHHLDSGCASSFTSRSKTHPSSSSQKPIHPLFQSQQKSVSAPSTSVSKKRAYPADPANTIAPATKRNKSTISANLVQANPLAERLRPSSISDFIGHRHLSDPAGLLMSSLAFGSLGSLILWGPPGCGKTTLARLIAKQTNCIFKELSATVVGINDVRPVFEEAKNTLSLTGRKTMLFLDEIHRFNRSQQDIFLPFLEQGHIQLVGATTENPSFKLNGALLSRCRVFVLERLTDSDIETIITNAILRVSSYPQEDQDTKPDANSMLSSQNNATPSSTQSTSSQSLSLSASTAESTSLFPSHPHVTQRVLSPFHHHHHHHHRFPRSTLFVIMGVTVESISPGDGKTFPQCGDKVCIHYVGTLLDGKKFDSSRDRGAPFETEIGVGKVIKGWDEGVPKLSLGEKAILTATPDYAYGARGFPPVIPPNSTLRFEVELLKIN